MYHFMEVLIFTEPAEDFFTLIETLPKDTLNVMISWSAQFIIDVFLILLS